MGEKSNGAEIDPTPSLSSSSSVISGDQESELKTPPFDEPISCRPYRRKFDNAPHATSLDARRLGRANFGNGMNHVYLTQPPTDPPSHSAYSTGSHPSTGMTQYSGYPAHAGLPGAGSYGAQYPSQYYGGVTSPQSAANPVSSSMGIANQLAPLPTLQMPQQQGYGAAAHGQGYPQPTQSQQQPPPNFDQTGQVQPAGAKPRVTATLWEDEGSLCFQVEAKGVCVARREDNHFINGTKLLNVAGMTRGRRDGILKSEKTRHVVKIGPMHLKGVWIPFDRALDFANREKITELLYPLFVHNISALLYHPQNAGSRGNGTLDRKTRERTSTGPQPTGLQHSIGGQISAPSPHSIAPHPTLNRPAIDRAHTFPTPPTSASAVPPQSSPYEWGSQSMPGAVQTSQALAIDTGLSNTRSMPTTPAASPPVGPMQNMPSYSAAGSYDVSRSMYSGAPQTPGQYATQQQNLARFGAPMHPHGYIKSEMGPPSRGNLQGEGDHADIKPEPYSQAHGSEPGAHGGDEEGEHEGEYGHDQNPSYSTTRGPYNYTPAPAIGSLPSDHSHISSEQVDNSPHQSGSGRVTPRTAPGQSNWASGFNTPPRTAGPSGLYGTMGDSRSSMVNGQSVGDYSSSSYSINGNKRARDEEDEYKPHSINGDSLDPMKRRKATREGSISSSSGMPFNYSRSNSAILQGAHR